MSESKKKKNVLINVCTFLCGLVIGGTLMYLVCGNKTESAKGTNLAYESDYPQVYGLDVSYWQGIIQWDQLSLLCDEEGRVSDKITEPCNQRPAQFVFIRATKYSSIVDSHYQRNYNEAKKLGIPCGAYHFLTDTASAKVQAELFLSHVQLEPGDLPPVLDVEIDSREIITKAKEWLEIVEKQCGVKAIIYTTMHIYETRIKNDHILSTRDLWLAKPRGEMPDVPNCKFWQFTHKGHVLGITDNVVDIDQFNGTLQDLRDYIQEKGIKQKVKSKK